MTKGDRMKSPDTVCTLVPYFKVADGQLGAFEALCVRFEAKTREEPKCVHYAFSFNGDEVHCREGYQDAEGVLAHIDNVGALLQEALQISQLTRLEVHAPEVELRRLREPMASLEPQWFTLRGGFRR
jgi:hypothetical protein